MGDRKKYETFEKIIEYEKFKFGYLMQLSNSIGLIGFIVYSIGLAIIVKTSQDFEWINSSSNGILIFAIILLFSWVCKGIYQLTTRKVKYVKVK